MIMIINTDKGKKRNINKCGYVYTSYFYLFFLLFCSSVLTLCVYSIKDPLRTGGRPPMVAVNLSSSSSSSSFFSTVIWLYSSFSSFSFGVIFFILVFFLFVWCRWINENVFWWMMLWLPGNKGAASYSPFIFIFLNVFILFELSARARARLSLFKSSWNAVYLSSLSY